MGYGLPAPGSRLSAPWRRGGAVCLCFGSCVYEARGAGATRAVCANTVEAYGPTKERDARAHHSHCRVAYFIHFRQNIFWCISLLQSK